jgi:hypothetical protein
VVVPRDNMRQCALLRVTLLLSAFTACAAPSSPPAYPPVTDAEVAQHAAAVAELASINAPRPVSASAPDAEARAALEESQAREQARRGQRREASEAADRECGAAAEAPAAPAPADNGVASRVAWVHDHCSAHQPPPVVTCNPVCVARRACFVWTCAEHPDWAEEVSISDCDGHREAKAISVRSGFCAARRHSGREWQGGTSRD